MSMSNSEARKREEASHVDDPMARLEEYERLWLWQDDRDDHMVPGFGAHMSQLLYRLPKDGQTADMKASIERMIADLRAALTKINGPILGQASVVQQARAVVAQMVMDGDLDKLLAERARKVGL